MKKCILLTLSILPFLLSINVNAQSVRSDHANPQSGTDYNGSTTSGCAPCTITNPAFAADSSLTNYAVVAAKGSASARAKLKVKLTDTAEGGGVAGIAMKRSGSANPAVLSKITINTYYNSTLQETKTGSGLSTYVLNATTGVRAIEFTTTKDFNYVEVEVHKLGGGINSIDLFYGYGEDPTPLPIELVSFNAVLEKDFVRINWTTASEYKTETFFVEKSTDGNNFSVLDEIPAAGNSNRIIKYSTIDFKPNDTNYYRLLEINKAGEAIYSKTVKVCRPAKEHVVRVNTYPNPATDVLTIDTKNLGENSRVEIRGLDGKIILSENLEKGPRKTIGIKSLEPGYYFLIVFSADNKLLHKQKIMKL